MYSVSAKASFANLWQQSAMRRFICQKDLIMLEKVSFSKIVSILVVFIDQMKGILMTYFIFCNRNNVILSKYKLECSQK